MVEFKGLIPELEIDDFRELIDNTPLLFFLIIGLVWAVYSVLLYYSINNLMGIMSIFLFAFMMFASIAIFARERMVTDFREKRQSLDYLLFITIGLALVIVTQAIWQAIYGGINIQPGSLWKPWRIELPQYHEAPIFINLYQIAGILQVNPQVLNDVMTNMFLVAPAEELVFRGAGMYLIGRYTGSPWVGGLISTGGWASLHAIQAYVGAEVVLFTIGAYIGGFWILYMIIYSMDITTGIIIHGLYNTSIILLGG